MLEFIMMERAVKTIDSLVSEGEKMNKKRCVFSFIYACLLYTAIKIVNKHEKEITNLKTEIKELKSKGE